MIILSRAQLAAELALLAATAERKTTMPILSTVKFDFTGDILTLTATDVDMTIVAEIQASGQPWAGCVPLKQLQELVRLANGDELELAPVANERIQVRWGKRSQHKLPVFPVSDFPETQQAQVQTVKLDGTQLKTALVRALRCTSPDAVEMWMHGISLRSRDGTLTVAGTNSRHFAVTELETALDIDVLLHVRAAAALVKFLDAEVEVGANDNQLVFRQGSRMFMSRLLDAKFPDWRPLLPPGFKHSFPLDGNAGQAFKLAAVTAKESALIPIPLRISLSQKEMTIETKDSEVGHSIETLPIDCPTLNGEKLTIGVNGQHFISFVDLESKSMLAFNDDVKLFQLTVEGEPNYRYITMTLKA